MLLEPKIVNLYVYILWVLLLKVIPTLEGIRA